MVSPMSNSPYVRASLALAALEWESPLIRKALLEDDTFRQEYSIETDAIVNFSDTALSVERSQFFDSVRQLLSSEGEIEIKDTVDKSWILSYQSDNGSSMRLVATSENQRIVLPDYLVLSPDSDIRVNALSNAVEDVNLPDFEREYWRKILEDRSLDDDEVEAFYISCRETPVQIERSINQDIKSGESSVETLVPSSRRYYERLVGVYDGSESIANYAVGSLQKIFTELHGWDSYRGVLLSLLLSSHSTLTDEICAENIEREDLLNAFKYLEASGDKLSQLGAFEVGLKLITLESRLEPILISFIEQIRDDNPENSMSDFKLLSALFVLVDGQLSRIRLFSSEPPFYRRLASLAHAALIQRQIISAKVGFGPLCEWIYDHCGLQYYWQNLADMRMEPRWNPDLIEPSQIKADFVGRIVIAAKKYESHIKDKDLHRLIFSSDPDSINALSVFPRMYYPGPLEGGRNTPNTLPEDLEQTIQDQLNSKDTGSTSFIALVNSSMVFKVEEEHAELAVKALKLANHRLLKVENKSLLISILNGLATVAAVSGSRMLAEELKILVRVYRRDLQYPLSIEEAARICLVTSASNQDLDDWISFCGGWLTELAFGELTSDEGERLHAIINSLCHAVPELWGECGKADAALSAYILK